jgi:hypothetical protein
MNTIHRKPFDVNKIKDEPMEPSMEDEIGKAVDEIGKLAGERKRPESPKSETEVEQGAFTILRKDGTSRTLITFVEDGGYPILRITTDGNGQDLVMNLDQIKLLLRQMTLWVTR